LIFCVDRKILFDMVHSQYSIILFVLAAGAIAPVIGLPAPPSQPGQNTGGSNPFEPVAINPSFLNVAWYQGHLAQVQAQAQAQQGQPQLPNPNIQPGHQSTVTPSQGQPQLPNPNSGHPSRQPTLTPDSPHLPHVNSQPPGQSLQTTSLDSSQTRSHGEIRAIAPLPRRALPGRHPFQQSSVPHNVEGPLPQNYQTTGTSQHPNPNPNFQQVHAAVPPRASLPPPEVTNSKKRKAEKQESEGKYECSKGCGKTFSRRPDMTRHARTAYEHRDAHEQPLAHVCPICDFAYSRADALKRHLDTSGPVHDKPVDRKRRKT